MPIRLQRRVGSSDPLWLRLRAGCEISGLVLALAVNVHGQTALPKSSPFLPAGAPTAAESANEVLEFAGVSSMGKKTQIIIYDKSTKKNRWIGVGETVDGIAVLNYDSRLEQTVVRSNGVQKILTLRKGGSAARAPAPVAPMPVGFATPPAIVKVMPGPPPSATVPPPPAPVAAAETPVAVPAKPEAPATPEVQARQETEARMLVSDLLEIGMAQRKAYEEAQRKAADPNAPPSSPPPPPAEKSAPTGGE